MPAPWGRGDGPPGRRTWCRRGLTIPALAPASTDMLQIVMRPSMESARMAAPRYSTAWPTPPPVPIFPMTARMRSLAVTPAGRSPSIVMAMVPGR